MSMADEIREYVRDTRIIPTRAKGCKTVDIRAGDIRDEMNQKSRPVRIRSSVVCGALQTKLFNSYADVIWKSNKGPDIGTNCVMNFEIL